MVKLEKNFSSKAYYLRMFRCRHFSSFKYWKNYYIKWNIGQNSARLQEGIVWKLRNGNARASNFSSEKWKTIKSKWLFDKIYYYGYQSKLYGIKISWYDIYFFGDVHYWITLIFTLYAFLWYNMHLRMNCLRKILRNIYG